MRSYRYLHLDVFTSAPFGGNQLAVLLDGRGLSDAVQQTIAKEMNFSETTFVLPAEDPATHLRVRIFTPGVELPMAGHPTIGTAFALARSGVVTPQDREVVFGLGVGPTPVTLTWTAGELTFAWMTQRVPVFGEPLANRGAAAASLRLAPEALVDALPVQVVSCGVKYVLVPLVSRAAVDRASADMAAYDLFRQPNGISEDVCVYLFSTEAAADGATAYARMFGPSIGIGEDPATGSAAGPLACYLVRHGLVSGPEAQAMRCLQGIKMGRPSTIHMSIDSTGGQIVAVRVGGQAVVVGEGILYVEAGT